MESLFVPLFFVAVPAAVATIGAAWAWRARTPRRRRSLLLGFAIALIGVPLAFFLMMLVGESITDLGAGPALATIGPWALAAIGYLALAWLRPDVALRILVVLTALPLSFGLWSTVDPASFGAWLDSVGPINLVAAQFLIGVAALVGLRRPRAAGMLIVVIAAVPALLPLVTIGEGSSRVLIVGALSLPAFLAGVLMILAGTPRFARREPGAPESPSDDAHGRSGPAARSLS
jgi:hypothetical protein